MRKTKIVATVGPACRSPEKLRALIEAGVNVFRLNFSHGTHDEHLEVLQTIRSLSVSLDKPVAILQDLAGPKIRISKVREEFAPLVDGGKTTLKFSHKVSEGQRLSDTDCILVEGVDPAAVMQVGHRALLADGQIELVATALREGSVECDICKGGKLRSRIGIAFPDSKVDLPATTDKDLVDFAWGLEHGVDYAAVSFVQSGADLRRLRDEISRKKADVKLIAKIERRAALENITEILSESDGLMVARGDLGVEIPLERVPMVEKDLIHKANERGVPVIVATQMLQSMVTSIRPTRAEATDVAFAVISGTDAVMLSEETAIGEHPIESVLYLGKIAEEAEKTFIGDDKIQLRSIDRLPISDAVAYAACSAALKIQATAIIACSFSGTAARLVAKYRPQEPIYGVSSLEGTLRRMALYWGVTPVRVHPVQTSEAETTVAIGAVKSHSQYPIGTRVVVTGGLVAQTAGSTNKLEIVEIQ